MTAGGFSRGFLYRWGRRALALPALLASVPAPAMDFAEACIAHLRKDHLEGNGYSVRGLVGQGDELTRYIDAQGLTRHHDYPHRQGYLMVRFDHGGYVMLELGAEGLPSHAVRTRDQRGRPWMVRQGSCGRQPRAPGDDRARGND